MDALEEWKIYTVEREEFSWSLVISRAPTLYVMEGDQKLFEVQSNYAGQFTAIGLRDEWVGEANMSAGRDFSCWSLEIRDSKSKEILFQGMKLGVNKSVMNVVGYEVMNWNFGDSYAKVLDRKGEVLVSLKCLENEKRGEKEILFRIQARHDLPEDLCHKIMLILLLSKRRIPWYCLSAASLTSG